ncbi:MAG TPA: MFS transporter [Ramlibacter sp.]|uniref:MFS transporter n=1 Tax=Ramlibacter sp. TaxID=1917967 RepID=UPI002D321AD5|nr:MFS transporter [Ramlibacter sp.]HZY19958.1 MFS transporter [Ramlibacter sp.]
MVEPQLRITAPLGAAQTLAWASSYYLLAVLAEPIAHELALPLPLVFAAFSLALVVSACTGPWAGRTIDRIGGRAVLACSAIAFAAGLALLSRASGLVGLLCAWALLGVAMAAGLYDAAFATLVRLHGQHARPSITGVTLMAGFASTVGWPASAWMASAWGWRGACLGWAALHLFVSLPLYLSLPRAPAVRERPDDRGQAAEPATPVPLATAAALAAIFAITWFTSTAMAAHLPRLLQAAGVTLATAVLVGALIGPAQVVARLLEFGVLQRFHPLLAARLAALGHPAGALALFALGPVAAPAFAVLHGMGNGIMTIANGALPLALFGPRGYGARQGWLMLPARMAQASAPFLFGLALERWGAASLWGTAALGMVSASLLLTLGRRPAAVQPS